MDEIVPEYRATRAKEGKREGSPKPGLAVNLQETARQDATTARDTPAKGKIK